MMKGAAAALSTSVDWLIKLVSYFYIADYLIWKLNLKCMKILNKSWLAQWVLSGVHRYYLSWSFKCSNVWFYCVG